jgi:hypothetical protein
MPAGHPPQVASVGLRCLDSLALTPDNVTSLVPAAALAVAALQAHDGAPDVVLIALTFLWRVSQTSHSLTEVLTAVPEVLRALETHVSSHAVLEAGLGVLRNVLIHVDDKAQLKSCIPAVLAALPHCCDPAPLAALPEWNHSTVKGAMKSALNLLCDLAKVVECQQLLLPALPTILAVAGKFPDYCGGKQEVAEAGLGLLWNLLAAPGVPEQLLYTLPCA